MRYIKSALVIAVVAAVLIALPVAAQQRVVRLSDADQAIMDDFWKACAAPVAAAKAAIVAAGERMPDAEFRQYMNGIPTEMREAAKFQDRPANAAFYRDAIAEARKSAADPTDPGAKIMLPVYVCLLETMIRHDGRGGAPGGTAIAKPSPASPAQPAADPTGGMATDCVVIDDTDPSYGRLRNKCSYPVYVTYCAFRPAPGSWNESFNCEKQQFGLDSIGANSVQAAHTKNAEYISVFACRKPKTPTGSRFDGKVIMSACK